MWGSGRRRSAGKFSLRLLGCKNLIAWEAVCGSQWVTEVRKGAAGGGLRIVWCALRHVWMEMAQSPYDGCLWARRSIKETGEATPSGQQPDVLGSIPDYVPVSSNGGSVPRRLTSRAFFNWICSWTWLLSVAGVNIANARCCQHPHCQQHRGMGPGRHVTRTAGPRSDRGRRPFGRGSRRRRCRWRPRRSLAEAPS